MGRTVEYIKIVEEDLRRGCRTKTAIPYGRDSCIAWNPCYIFITSVGPMPKAVFVSLVCGKAKMNHIYSSRDIETA